jgi:hypothetical protein
MGTGILSKGKMYAPGRDGKCKNCKRTGQDHRKTRRGQGVYNLCYHKVRLVKGSDGIANLEDIAEELESVTISPADSEEPGASQHQRKFGLGSDGK